MGKYGNEFLEFEVSGDGTLKYANNSNYRKDGMIKKQARLSLAVVDEIKRLALSRRILECDDAKWPEPDRNGRQELELRIGNTHLSFVTNKITLMEEIERSSDPQGLGAFSFFVHDVRALVLALVSLHFKVNAV
jgi:protein mago nashi